MSSSTPTTDSMSHRLMIVTSDENIIHQIQSSFNSSSCQTIILNSESTNTECSNASNSADERQSKKKQLICVICGATALGRNFGVAACESCKIFFRRNGLKDPTKLICEENNQCEVHAGIARRCLTCRLRKCLDSGMKRDRLLKAEEKAAKRQKNQKQESHQVPLSLQSLKIHNSISIQSIPHRNLLTSNDIERIETFRIAFENRIALASQEGFRNSYTMLAQNIPQLLNTHSVVVLRLLAYFRQIPDFNQLNVSDKMILIKYNIIHVLALNYVISFKIIGEKVYQVDPNVAWNGSLLEAVHGESIFFQLKKIFQPLKDIAETDQKVFLITFMIFILLKGLSTGEGIPEPLLLDGMTVYRVQNSYTELLWKYLETTYDFHQAVQIMSNLVTRLLTWQLFYRQMRSNVDKLLAVKEDKDVLPIMKSIFHI